MCGLGMGDDGLTCASLLCMQLTLFNNNVNIQQMTVGHLLAMKSGVQDYDDSQVGKPAQHSPRVFGALAPPQNPPLTAR
eukprot:COSAG05_NODE_5214_length_1234_cov_6.612153_2_plen_79_part_00